jgi:23S rRNA (uracil-5-)-methyltransferase RumA
MKKGDIVTGVVEKVEFPNKGILKIDGKKIQVKNVMEGQQVEVRLTKKRKDKMQGMLLQVLEKSSFETNEDLCPHFGQCGGCTYQSMGYDHQLSMKEKQVKEMLQTTGQDFIWDGILGSPIQTGYRNKMEFSFGDEYKDGPLALGLHKRNSTYDIVDVLQCRIVDEDCNKILSCVREYMKKNNLSFHHKMRHEGYLRHLVLRRSIKTGDILLNLVTTSEISHDFSDLTEELKALPLDGKIVGILHTINDSLSDVVQCDSMEILFGQDFIYEYLFNLKFKISPFSFFQTNTLGAEVLYEKAREYVGETKNKVIFDLYSGTGTIAQILAPVAEKVVGVEIVEEAVEAARENAKMNGLSNCEFLAGDVLKVIDDLEEKPDIIVVDPPREGIHPKALGKIAAFGVKEIVYISCKPSSLVRDLEQFKELGYQLVRAAAIDQFPGTYHVECVVLMSKAK